MEEALKLVTWHHMTFIFSLVFIFAFRQPISDLIERITHISKSGVAALPIPEAQREKADTASETVQQLLDVVGSSIVINELEENIYTDLQKEGLSSESDTTKVLVKHLAGAQLLLAFEQMHSLIFSSQIFLLKKLNEVTGQGISLDQVNGYIETVKNEHPGTLGNWTADQYLLFLRSHHLITDHDNYIHITNLGVEYITWIVRSGRSEKTHH